MNKREIFFHFYFLFLNEGFEFLNRMYVNKSNLIFINLTTFKIVSQLNFWFHNLDNKYLKKFDEFFYKKKAKLILHIWLQLWKIDLQVQIKYDIIYSCNLMFQYIHIEKIKE